MITVITFFTREKFSSNSLDLVMSGKSFITVVLLSRHAVIIMEYVGSRNLHRLLVELREKTLGTTFFSIQFFSKLDFRF